MSPLLRSLSVGALLVTASSFAACSGSSPASPTPYPTLCPTLALAPPTLVSPANNATGVPDANVVVTVTNFAATEQLALDPTAGIGPPVGSLSVSTVNGTTTVAFGTLPAATQYTVVALDIPQGCNTGGASIGKFTTQ
jgi:hypothetical protein